RWMVPSGLRSTTTSRGPKRTARIGGFDVTQSDRSFSRTREPRVSCSESAAWVPAFAGTSGERSVSAERDMILIAHRLRRSLLEKGFQPRLGLVVVLGDGGDQRLGEIAARRIGLRDARQHVGDGKVGHRGIARDALGKFEAFGQTRALLDQIVGNSDRLAFLRVL